MSLSSSYRMHNYMGEYASDADCLTFIRANKWDSTGDGNGNPRSGMQYYSTASNQLEVYASSSWVALSSSGTPAGSTGYVQFNNAGAFAADAGFFWDNTNKRLGIGTTAGVDVGGTVFTYPLMVYGTDSSPHFNGIISEGGASPARFNGHRHNGTYGTKTAVSTTQNILAINALGWDGGTTPTYVNAAAISFTVDGTVAEDSVPGKIIFYTREVGNTVGPYERMVITNVGKVGIANNAPTRLFTLGTNGVIGGAIDLLGATSGTCTIQVAAAAGTTTFQLPTTNGTNTYFLQTNGSGITSWASALISPAGATTQVQYNNSGSFGASANLTFSGTTLTLSGDAALAYSVVECFGDNSSPSLILRRSRGSRSSPAAINSGDGMGLLVWQGAESGGTANAAFITAWAEGNFTSIYHQASLLFYMMNGISQVERMRLTSAGRLGINNISPNALLGLGTPGTTAGSLSMAGSSSGEVILQTAASAGTWTMTLPTTGGTNGYFLQTNGSGVTTWAAASSGGTPAGSTGYVQFNTGGAFDAESTLFWDKTNDRLGIGHAVPSVSLDVRSASAAHQILLTSVASATGSALGLYKSRGTLAAPTSTQSGDVLGTLYFDGYGTTWINTATIHAVAEELFTVSTGATRLVFSTAASGSTSATERMRIAPDGKVRLGGTYAPVWEVQTSRVGYCGIAAIATSNTAAAYGYLVVGRSRGTDDAAPTPPQSGDSLGGVNFCGYEEGYRATAQILSIASQTWSSGNRGTNLTFSTTASVSTTLAERMRITNAGLVGIANVSPSALLTLGTAGTTAGSLSLAGATTGTCTVQVAAAAGTTTFQLPATNGTSGYYLQTNGSGVTSWATMAIGGSNTHVQFNNNGSFDGTNKLTYSGSILTLTGDSVLPNFFVNAYGSGYQSSIMISRSNGSMSSPSTVLSADALGIIGWRGWDGSAWGNAAFFGAYAEGNFTDSYHQATVRLYMMNGISQEERLRITSTGLVGIGNISPSALLTLGTAGTTAGTLSLAGSSSGTCTIQVAASAGTTIFQLPASNGTSGYFLQTDGSGIATWAAATSAPAGNDKQLQFNDSGTMAGAGSVYWNKTTTRLGIGTSSPSTRLHMYNSGSESILRIQTVFTTTPGGVEFYRARTSNTAVQSNDALGILNFYGDSGSATYRNGATIGAYAAETFTTSTSATNLIFKTTPTTTTTPLERMQITAAGNLFIGTTGAYSVLGATANYLLQISGADSGSNYAGIAQETADVQARFLGLRCNGSLASKTAVIADNTLIIINAHGWDAGTTPTYVSAASIQLIVDGTVAEDSVPGRISFWTRTVGNTSASPVERIRIDNAGKLTSYQMYSGYTVGGTNKAMYVDDTGLIGVLSSSRRTKENIADMEDISWVDQLHPVNFAYRSTPCVKQYGLIAEEVAEVNNLLVGYDTEGLPDSVTYDRLVPVLLKAVQELREEIRLLKLN
jgi:hypothetical protein